MTTKVLVTGAGGFIGGHLCRFLKERGGYWVRGVDVKPLPESWGEQAADEFHFMDLRYPQEAAIAVAGIDHVYALAADMGGMGYIAFHNADILHNNALININTLNMAQKVGVQRYFYTSSACIYPEELQTTGDMVLLKEDDAIPASPDTSYGWEKLFTEILCRHYAADYGMTIRVARFHNIFGPCGAWCGGREKAPAALCRKVAEAKLSGRHQIDVWGDGQQIRSFCYISDCLMMIHRLMYSDYMLPLNIGTDEAITIDELAYMIADIAGIKIELVHDLTKPVGVRSRNADLTRMHEVLHYYPQVSLYGGLIPTYQWIEEQVQVRDRGNVWIDGNLEMLL